MKKTALHRPLSVDPVFALKTKNDLDSSKQGEQALQVPWRQILKELIK